MTHQRVLRPDRGQLRVATPRRYGRCAPARWAAVPGARRRHHRRRDLGPSRPDPVVFLGYWNNPEATAAKLRDGWLLTGDLGECDDDGYLWFIGRADDVISSGGYRIGPGEIEDCLVGHRPSRWPPRSASPTPIRGEVVKAFVVLGARPRPGTPTRGRAPGLRPDAARGVRVSAADRVRRRAADDHHREDPARELRARPADRP